MMAPAEKPRAYLYSRVSSASQAKDEKHGLSRQQDEGARFAVSKGYVVDKTFRLVDAGVSAARSKNIRRGELSRFVQAAKDGLIPAGSLLVLDDYSRFSRDSMDNALYDLLGLIRSEIDLGFVRSNRILSREALRANGVEIMFEVMGLAQANAENQAKGRMVKLASSRRLEQARRGERLFTSRLPSWMRKGKNGKPELIPERVKIVRRMLALTKEGRGPAGVAQELNRDGVTPWGPPGRIGKYWHRSSVLRVLNSPALYGVFVPHENTWDDNGRLRRQPLPAIVDYFPPVITKREYQDMHRTRGPKGARAFASTTVLKNPLGYILFCAQCGATMAYTHKDRGKPSLVCARAKAKAAGCEYISTRLSLFSERFLEELPRLLADVPIYSEALEAKLAAIASELEGLDDAITTVADNLQRVRSSSLAERLRALEGSRQEVRGRQKKLLDHAELVGRVTAARPVEVLEAAAKAGAITDTAAFNVALRELVERIEYHPSKGEALIRWRGETFASFQVHMREAPRPRPTRGKAHSTPQGVKGVSKPTQKRSKR